MPNLGSLALTAVALTAVFGQAISLDVNDVDSIKYAAQIIAKEVIDIYNNGSDIPGLFPEPYYWWESGLAFDSLVNYWAVTGDNQYNDLVSEALLFQRGPNNDYMPPNRTKSEGNDDQATWGLAATTAAEYNFPLPASADASVSWVQLARNVLDSQLARWDTATCGGGLRWQIFTFNNGYNYKNSFSNGDFVQLAARLAKHTGNTTYSDCALQSLQWSVEVGLIVLSSDGSSNTSNASAQVFDGTSVESGCTSVNHIQWTANVGTYLSGAAYAWNQEFAVQLGNSLNGVFSTGADGVLYEVSCAPNNNCNTDQLAFKAIAARSLARAVALISSASTDQSFDAMQQLIQRSAKGAAAQCSGGSTETLCGSDWSTS